MRQIPSAVSRVVEEEFGPRVELADLTAFRVDSNGRRNVSRVRSYDGS